MAIIEVSRKGQLWPHSVRVIVWPHSVRVATQCASGHTVCEWPHSVRVATQCASGHTVCELLCGHTVREWLYFWVLQLFSCQTRQSVYSLLGILQNLPKLALTQGQLVMSQCQTPRPRVCPENFCNGGECLVGWDRVTCDCSATEYTGNRCLQGTTLCDSGDRIAQRLEHHEIVR